jgi:hypothetical protein
MPVSAADSLSSELCGATALLPVARHVARRWPKWGGASRRLREDPSKAGGWSSFCTGPGFAFLQRPGEQGLRCRPGFATSRTLWPPTQVTRTDFGCPDRVSDGTDGRFPVSCPVLLGVQIASFGLLDTTALPTTAGPGRSNAGDRVDCRHACAGHFALHSSDSSGVGLACWPRLVPSARGMRFSRLQPNAHEGICSPGCTKPSFQCPAVASS